MALDSGFYDHSDFARQFHRHPAMPPINIAIVGHGRQAIQAIQEIKGGEIVRLPPLTLRDEVPAAAASPLHRWGRYRRHPAGKS